MRDDHGNTVATASPAEAGERVSGSLQYPGDADAFAFDAREGSPTGSKWLWVPSRPRRLGLYDSSGGEVASYSLYDGSRGSAIVWRAQSAGKVYAEVTGWGTGTYALTVAEFEDDHGNVLAVASPVAVGESIRGSIEYACDRDVFAFDARARDLYEIELAPGTLFDSELGLYHPGGGRLASTSVATPGGQLAYYDADGRLIREEDGEAPPPSRLTWRAGETGKLFAAVGGDRAEGTGTYTLAVSVFEIEDDRGNTIETASPAAIGEPVPGSIEYRRDVDVFAFDVRAGGLYEIDVSLGTLYGSWLVLYDSNGEDLNYSDDQGGSRPSRLVWRADATGKLFAAVGGLSERTGTYFLTVSISDIGDDHGNAAAAASPRSRG